MSPNLTETERAAVQVDISAAIELLSLETEAVGVELGLVSGPALRVEPDAYKEIAIIGDSFTPGELRMQTTVDARDLDTLAERLLSGSASSYLSDAQEGTLQGIRGKLKRLIENALQLDLEQITDESLSTEHLESHIGTAKELIDKAERMIVSAEAAEFPVREPSERGINLGSLIGLSVVAAAAWLVAEIA